MKRHIIILLLFTSMIIILIGCSKKCEDFNNDIVDWMPYKVTDKIVIFRNSDSDTLTVTFSEINHTNKIRYGSKCMCENSFTLNLSSDYLNIDIRFYNSWAIEQSEFIINDEWMSYLEQLDTMELNGHTFTDVLIFKNANENSSLRFKKIIISKSIGIIAIIELNDEWLIIDYSKKHTEISDIEFKSTDC